MDQWPGDVRSTHVYRYISFDEETVVDERVYTKNPSLTTGNHACNPFCIDKGY